MAIDREQRSTDLDNFGKGPLFAPVLPKPILKPLDVHVARAAANALKVNVVNTNFEIRELGVAQGVQFPNDDFERKIRFLAQGDPTDLASLGQFTTPTGLVNDFPDIVIRDDNNAVFISDAQRVEFRIRVINTKDVFKTALETPGIHVIYSGHARFGRGACFAPDLPSDPAEPGGQDLTGNNWEMGTDPVKFGLFRMGHPFVGVPFVEIDEHKYRMRPGPTSVKVNSADMYKALANPNSLRPIILRGTRFESFILDPVVDTYWGCTTVHGPGVLLFADFQNTATPTFPSTDLGATNIQCRCFTVIACETFDHFNQILL